MPDMAFQKLERVTVFTGGKKAHRPLYMCISLSTWEWLWNTSVENKRAGSPVRGKQHGNSHGVV